MEKISPERFAEKGPTLGRRENAVVVDSRSSV